MSEEYRTLKVGERLQEGDEYHSDNGWVPTTCAGDVMGKSALPYYRRKIQPEIQPEYRTLEAGETIREGDEFSFQGRDPWQLVTHAAIGTELLPENVGSFRRKIQSKYRMLEAGEVIQDGDEYRPDISSKVWETVEGGGDRLYACNVGRFRRKVAPAPTKSGTCLICCEQAYFAVQVGSVGVCEKCRHGAREFEKMQAERDDLRAWQESMLTVEREWDSQEVGRLLGMTMGTPILRELKPAIEKLMAERSSLRNEILGLWSRIHGESAVNKILTEERNEAQIEAGKQADIAKHYFAQVKTLEAQNEGSAVLISYIRRDREKLQEELWQRKDQLRSLMAAQNVNQP